MNSILRFQGSSSGPLAGDLLVPTGYSIPTSCAIGVMPAIPPALSEWLALLTQPAVILLGVGLIVNQQNKRTDDLNKRMDDLREGMNKRIDELREDMKAIDARQQESMKELREDVNTRLDKLETRQREDMKELREDNKALNEKLDRLLEARLSTSTLS